MIEHIINLNYKLLFILEKYNFNINEILNKKSNIKIYPLFHNIVYKTCGNSEINITKYLTNEMINYICEDNKTLLSNYIIFDEKLFIKLVNENIIKDDDIKKILITELIYIDNIIEYLLINKEYIFTKKIILDCIESCLDNSLIIIIKFKKYFNIIENELKDNNNTLINFINSNKKLKFLVDNNILNDNILSKNNYEILFKTKNYNLLNNLINIININKIIDIKNNETTLLHKLALYPDIIYDIMINYKENNDINNKIYYNKFNKTFLDILIDNEFNNDVINIINLYDDKNIYNFLVKDNKLNIKLIKLLCKINKINYILNKIENYKSVYDMLNIIDNKNNNLLWYIFKFSICEFNKIFDLIDYKLLINKNMDDEDLIKLITKDNHKILEKILDIENIKDSYNNFSDCFLIACKYNHYSLNLLLNKVKIKYINYGINRI